MPDDEAAGTDGGTRAHPKDPRRAVGRQPAFGPDQVTWVLTAGSSRWVEVTPDRAVRRLSWLQAEGFRLTRVDLRHEPSGWCDRWDVEGYLDGDESGELLVCGDETVPLTDGDEWLESDLVVALLVEATFPRRSR